MNKAIYDKAFSNQRYSRPSNRPPRFDFAERWVQKFGKGNVADVGSGRGQFLNWLRATRNCTGLDVSNYMDHPEIPFLQFDLLGPEPVERFGIVTCLDVLEHLEPAVMGTALRNLSVLANKAIITVSNHSDVIDGVELHLTQEGLEYWEDQVSQRFRILHTETHLPSYFFACESLG